MIFLIRELNARESFPGVNAWETVDLLPSTGQLGHATRPPGSAPRSCHHAQAPAHRRIARQGQDDQ
ncbi:hypothetical protein XAP412_760062 [Xanthomonas phaseoli pv. phaseoli]|uniref:Uncharacterized protein n=1 Tax=Xanthomonas campestris pv. phaseoli TaxID=317013 RepID=A0AB38E4G0_XANCH|nr:hypothetical protein XAP6984_800062 [Xanthomonas phaseoli pv. phaseoli]SON89996.1 hypothetical protein XAP412_760062 [Xanthomonas phaseoli pv. phaseoli]SON92394.1 hypothetical protein XAP7430_760062 [Xanthomonas phaseoli pv. phaseoli]SOO29294.1 hypothetical protein XAP6164_3210005 [Xanthomonas phaseoli pv. phaseoli]